MLPSQFMAQATSLDVGLLDDYYDQMAEMRLEAEQEAELRHSADRAAADARGKL